MRLNSQQLRTTSESEAKNATLKVRNPLYLVLENVYDTYNIGGLFRLADALNVERLYLCGIMETPPNPKIKKASIGTYKIVPWTFKKSVNEAIQEIQLHLKDENKKAQIIAVEQDKKSIPYTSIRYTTPTILIVGNETYGVLPETLDLVDAIAEIPMWGINKSLNVIVSAAIVSFEAMRQLQQNA